MPLKRSKQKYFSPFPSPGVYTSRRSYTAIYPTNKPCKSNKRKKHLRNRQKILSHLSKARDLRLKHSIEQSVRSHIDRLTECRRKNMTQPDLPYFPFLAHPVCSCTSSCTIPKKQLTTKKLKKIKKQEIRNVNLEQLESNSHSLELEIKKIMESIQIFEKQKQEFLSSLSKIQANISSLSLTQPVYVKEVAENDEKIKVKKITSQTIKSNKAISSKLKKRPALRSKDKITHIPQNIMDNLSNMLMNSPQRPSKTETNTATHGSGIMNLTQAFCSMATGF